MLVCALAPTRRALVSSHKTQLKTPKRRAHVAEEIRPWLQALDRDGYCVVPGYASPEQCRRRIAELDRLERLLQRRPQRQKTFIAPAGTLLLVNTSAIHRGQPLEHGTRYALTNYFVQRRRAGAAMDAHFAPVLRGSEAAAGISADPDACESAYFKQIC